MKSIYRMAVGFSLLLGQTGALAGAQTLPTEKTAPRVAADHAERDVQAAMQTLNAIAQLGKTIQARQLAPAPVPRSIFKDLSTTDPAYADLNTLQQHGVLKGYPDGYFGGKRILPRYEFAVAVQRMLAPLEWLRPDRPRSLGGSDAARYPLISDREAPAPLGPGYAPADLLILSHLVDPFKEELKALGVDAIATRKGFDKYLNERERQPSR